MRKRVIAGIGATSLAVLSTFLVPPASQAAPTDLSEGLGRFLGGQTVAGSLDNIAAVAGAFAENPSGIHPTASNPLSATVLNTLGIDLSGIQLLGTNGLIQLGAVAQLATAEDDGTATAGSGAVSNTGGITIGGAGAPPANATINLNPLLPPVSGILSAASIELGAVSSVGSVDSAGVFTGDYNIADATLTLTSPLVGGVYTSLQNAIVPVQNSVNGLSAAVTTALNTALANINVGGILTAGFTTPVTLTPPNLTALLPVGPIGGAGGVTVNLQTGEVVVDIEALLAAHPTLPGLNDLDPNTELLSGDVLAAIAAGVTTSITNIVQTVVANVETAIETTNLAFTYTVSANLGFGAFNLVSLGINAPLSAINDGSATVTVTALAAAGVVNTVLGLLGLPNINALASGLVNTALAAVGGVFGTLTTLTSVTNTLTGGLSTNVVGPVLDLLNDVASVTVNVRPPAGDLGAGSSTVRALSVGLTLPAAGQLALVNLASSTVRGTVLDALTAVPLNSTGLLAGGALPTNGPVTITGTGFTPTTTVLFGGVAVPTTVAADGLSLTYTPPAGTIAGTSVSVSVQRDADSVVVGTHTYQAPTITADSPASPGNPVLVTGTGWPANTSVTIQLVDGADAPLGSPVVVVTDASGSFPPGTQVVVPPGTPDGTDYAVTAVDTFLNDAEAPLAIASNTDDNTDDNTAVNTDDNTAVNTDDNTAVNTDDNTAVNTDDNTAVNTDDNTAVNTDDNTAVNTDDNTAVNTDDNTAVNTDDNTTDNTDDNTLDSTTDNTDDNTDDNTGTDDTLP